MKFQHKGQFDNHYLKVHFVFIVFQMKNYQDKENRYYFYTHTHTYFTIDVSVYTYHFYYFLKVKYFNTILYNLLFFN